MGVGKAAGAARADMSDQTEAPPEAAVEAPAGAERRQSERRTVNLPGKIIADGQESDCSVYDISPEGALVSACEGVALNQAIRLKVTANGEFLGLVVWRKDGRMGLKFMQFEDDGMRLPSKAEAALRKVSLRKVS